MPETEQTKLIKFIAVSVASFFIGSIHGVLQVVPPVRAWLDSIGSPYGGPGHMIDPLAHAHINLIGGVMLLAMATAYYLIPKLTNCAIHSPKLVDHSFWWTTLGMAAFYSSLMAFGAIEGTLLLNHSPAYDEVHKLGGPVIAITAMIMGIGMWIYLTNIALTLKNYYSR